jgi:protein ImuA
VDADKPRERFWALEQALKADPDELAAVLAWLPLLRAEQMRRLCTLAAGCRALVFVLRPGLGLGLGGDGHASAAPLRLLARPGAQWAQIELQLLKRQGPPLERPLRLCLAPPTLQAVLPLAEPSEPPEAGAAPVQRRRARA